ncbi:ATP-binding protein [Pedobacter antarcticus]|uniref:ATP-binding protein n=1 Tax=Pedobacter antarcticus TaxID=34086 RepID=UPI001C579FBD|nr:ATP-binding protein [Pedobacter antarcticus]
MLSTTKTDNILSLINVACFQLDSESNFIYGNRKAAELFNLDIAQITGKYVWKVFDISLSPEAFSVIENAIVHQKSSNIEYFCRFTNNWMSLNAVPANGGTVLMFTEVQINKSQLLEEQRRLKLAQEIGNIGYFEGMLPAGRLEASDELYCILGMKPQIEALTLQRIYEFIDYREAPKIVDLIEDLIGKLEEFELHFPIITFDNERKVINMKVRFTIDVIRNVQRIYGVIHNITDYFNAKEELRGSKELIQSVFDTSLVGMCLLKPVRNEVGEITDFRIELVSREMERETSRNDLVGKFYAAEFPGIRNVGLFQMMLNVMATGDPAQMEFRYPYDGFDKWYSSMFVKMEDAIVATHLDISPRKFAEQQQLKGLSLLQQSEELAKTGSWEYDLVSGEFTCSDGMYSLFDLTKEMAVTPEHYLEYSTEDSKPTAQKILESLKSGDSGFEEIIELKTSKSIRLLKVKAFIFKENSVPQKVLGVNIDITLQLALSLKNEQLKLEKTELEKRQQQEIFRTILSTQQGERKVIAENLHNGLGQLLYGVKLRLERNIYTLGEISADDQLDSMRETERLLADAIRESRRFSHQLMPTILEDFGLEAALNDVKSQLEVSVRIDTVYLGLEHHLDHYLQISIFRIVQELLLNVVKHSHAKCAKLKVSVTESSIHIVVQDDGRGFDVRPNFTNGLGLRMIQSKANLLNGKLEIQPVSGKGTRIEINLPNFEAADNV